MARLVEDKMILVQFLDILAMSILMPAVPPTILKTGGTLMHLGLFMSISAAVRLISSKICAELLKVSGKQALLYYSLIISCALNALLLLTSSFYGIMLNRVLFIFFNQVYHISTLISSNDKTTSTSALKNPLTQRLIAGLSGCAIVGSIIDSQGGFYVLVLLAMAISAIAVAVVVQDSPVEKEKKKLLTSEVVNVLKKTSESTFKEIQDLDIHFANWDALLIKSLLVINAKVVFILFVVLIIFVFQGKGSLVNATAAYQTIVLSVSGVAFEKINSRVNNLAGPKQILEKSLILCTVFALFQSCSPSYTFYLSMFVPFVISRSFVEYYYQEVFETKKNQKLAKDLETITTITEIFGPLFVGLLFQLLKENAYRLLTVLPFAAIYLIVSKKVYKEVTPEKISEKEEKKTEADKDK